MINKILCCSCVGFYVFHSQAWLKLAFVTLLIPCGVGSFRRLVAWLFFTLQGITPAAISRYPPGINWCFCVAGDLQRSKVIPKSWLRENLTPQIKYICPTADSASWWMSGGDFREVALHSGKRCIPAFSPRALKTRHSGEPGPQHGATLIYHRRPTSLILPIKLSERVAQTHECLWLFS